MIDFNQPGKGGRLLGWRDAVREGGDAPGELLIGAFSIKLKQGGLRSH
jgi:hypothetical protein